MASFVVFFFGIKAFDWLRLFEQTSFFVRLITETLQDICYFALIFLLTLGFVGTTMFMLSIGGKGSPAIVNRVTGNFLLDSMLNQYMLTLGEFAMDGFEDNRFWFLCYIFFI